MNNTIQVVCGATGESYDVEPRFLPDAREHRAACPCDECGSVEYRESV
jgi:hypothetical protein